MTHKNTWKNGERRVGRFFGVERRALSGGNSKSGGTDDCTHPRMYIEVKYRKNQPVYNLYRQCKIRSKGKTVVVVLQTKRSPGQLLVLHSNDLIRVAIERIRVLPEKHPQRKLLLRVLTEERITTSNATVPKSLHTTRHSIPIPPMNRGLSE